jgi:hypothetical protein
MNEYYDRVKLYTEVWADPMTKLSKKFGISDVGLEKICKNSKFPVHRVSIEFIDFVKTSVNCIGFLEVSQNIHY